MAVRDEGHVIAQALMAILAQEYPASLIEIIIADGMSTDETRNIIGEIRNAHPDYDVRIIDNPRQIVSSGLNLAVGRARGDVIIRVDGRALIAPNYVSECVHLLSRGAGDNVGGRMVPVASGRVGEAVVAATTSRFGIGGGQFHYSEREELVETVYLGAWLKETLQRLGPFDETLVRNQDDDMNNRLLATGGRILLSPRIRSTYSPRTRLDSLWRQYYEYGWWKVRVFQKRERLPLVRHFVPSAFVLALATSAIVTVVNRVGAIVFIALTGTYILATVVTSVRCFWGKPWKQVATLSAVFATLHFSYGSGMLIGALAILNPWERAAERSDKPVP